MTRQVQINTTLEQILSGCEVDSNHTAEAKEEKGISM